MKRLPVLCSISVLTLLLLVLGSNLGTGQDQAADQSRAQRRGARAEERTRKQVRMLDAIYKGSIVLITKNYVEDENVVPAGTVFKQVFAIAKDNGFHEVRLLDATGEPYNDENAPRDEFEKKAIQELKGGKNWYEEIVSEDDRRFLRVATPIPVVMDRCVMCHDQYADAKPGAPIGALGYKVPIE